MSSRPKAVPLSLRDMKESLAGTKTKNPGFVQSSLRIVNRKEERIQRSHNLDQLNLKIQIFSGERMVGVEFYL